MFYFYFFTSNHSPSGFSFLVVLSPPTPFQMWYSFPLWRIWISDSLLNLLFSFKSPQTVSQLSACWYWIFNICQTLPVIPKYLALLELMSSVPDPLGMQWRRGHLDPPNKLSFSVSSGTFWTSSLPSLLWPDLKATMEVTKGQMSRASLKI